MHGRLKVRTTEEEKIRKKNEQDIKVKAYRAAMSKVYHKRKNGELDFDLYELTSKILMANPDIATLWNIRREVILKLTTDNNENCELYTKDLGFTEQCLRVQPKSYSAWHHRCWVLENCGDPDWKKEVALCTQYLKMDERNFHCWDYRRYVVQKAAVSTEKELEFCTEKIEKNFSNYSSWHYRSKLLPTLFPHPTDTNRPISEDKLKEELVLVLNAAFTEPNDSSAWFYQRWLLGYSQPELDLVAFRLQDEKVTVAFTLPVALNEIKSFHGTQFDDQLNSGVWQSANNEIYSTVWFMNVKLGPGLDTSNISEVKFETNESTQLKLSVKCEPGQMIGVKMPRFGYEFQAAVLDVLRNQLQDCQELLELEPDSKWTLLTAALLMRAIDRDNAEYHKQSLEFLNKLQAIDCLRKGYYQDLASKWNIEWQLKKWIESGQQEAELDLSKLGLTSLHYEQYMSIVTSINLSDNSLSYQSLARLKSLQCCRRINLCNNSQLKLVDLSNFPNFAEIKLENDNI